MTVSAAISESKPISKLQTQLAVQIVRHIRDDDLAPGTPLTEIALAEMFGVSRSPIRGALEYLASEGAIDSTARRGYAVAASSAAIVAMAGDDTTEDNDLYLEIARDYTGGRLPTQISEADLMRRYDMKRGPLLRLLQRMSRDGVIERSPGHGWHFGQMLNTIEAHDASYRFRLTLEPAAILEPGYTLDERWARRVREAHEEMLASLTDEWSPMRFTQVNTDFHSLVASGSRNPFFVQAVDQQSRLRRFVDYDSLIDVTRVRLSLTEHLGILTALEAGDEEWGAALMRRHIEIAGQDKPRDIGRS